MENGKRVRIEPGKNLSELQKSVMQNDMFIFSKHRDIKEFVRKKVDGEFPEDFIDTEEKRNAQHVRVELKKINGREAIVRTPMTLDQFNQYRKERREQGMTFKFYNMNDDL